MSVSRRDFLKYAGIGGSTVALGAMVYRVGYWWDQPASPHYEVLSGLEGRIVASICDALFPGDAGVPPLPNAVDIGIVSDFDRYLAGLPEQPSKMLRALLHLIDDAALMSGLGFKRFHKRERDDREEILRAWDNSDVTVRRSAFRGLKFSLSISYCNHPRVLDVMGMHYTCGGVG